ncbi:MAG: hypothetical protein F4018_01940 [Acidobacteria bacterium]|nr:hypothetical protein [Acidobacteriota bacterium]MYK87195.1 hypothetical protein [Acidobacteriota bacterium]
MKTLTSLILTLTLAFGAPTMAMAATDDGGGAVTPSIVRYVEQRVRVCTQEMGVSEDGFPVEVCRIELVRLAIVETIRMPGCIAAGIIAAGATTAAGVITGGAATYVCDLITEQ